ncbi:DICT sensory domain-containing protein [Alkalicoccus chagannorensis]|uniref:DICT sensory domain-containing protein n=1 Tax=Alkalicoccus chagannorensis TaxID=427072 RepID=UPI00054EEBBA|nr:DICT sensory domain-containing protein [Alkalicoccus chagannorensis]
MSDISSMSVFQTFVNEVSGDHADFTGGTSAQKLESSSLKYESKVPQLEYMCLMMENMVIKKKMKAVVYAGFQKLSRAEAIMDRYLEMAETADIYIFGENDKKLPDHPNITYVHLPKNAELMKEWFLVIDGPAFKSMMVAQDQDGFGTKAVEEDRHFKGVKSSSPGSVKKAVSLLEGAVS